MLHIDRERFYLWLNNLTRENYTKVGYEYLIYLYKIKIHYLYKKIYILLQNQNNNLTNTRLF